MEGQVQAQKEKPSTIVDCKGNMNKSSTQPPHPQVIRSISNKEKRGILNKTFNLEKSSPIVTTFLEIKIVYTCCSATNTFCL
jgi:hypothetical protein